MDYNALSKKVSHALRHDPSAYNITLDNNGWTSLDSLVQSFRHHTEWERIERSDIMQMIDKSSKRRHEIHDGKIRAIYGHSVEQKILKNPTAPPAVLYHGTKEGFLESIKESGLLPMSRQYVHLSIDAEQANMVASRRKQGKNIVLLIAAMDAYNNGISFYEENNGIWLSNKIPVKFISLE